MKYPGYRTSVAVLRTHEDDEAVRLLRAMEALAGEGGMLPEQVWDTTDIPERGLYLGRPTGSAMPLAWAHAEYLKLRRSLADNRIFDTPPQTVKRYVVEKVVSPFVVWRTDHRRRTIPAGKVLRIEAKEPAVIQWDADGGSDHQEARTRDTGVGGPRRRPAHRERPRGGYDPFHLVLAGRRLAGDKDPLRDRVVRRQSVMRADR
jgi:hypothetical protein